LALSSNAIYMYCPLYLLLCKEKALAVPAYGTCGLCSLPAWLSNCVAACGLVRSMSAYDGGFGVYS